MIARLMKRLQVFACGALLSFSAGVVQAQSPAPIWTGAYLVVHGGGVLGSMASLNKRTAASVLLGDLAVCTGYQWQSGNWILDAEGDVSFGKHDKKVVFVK